MNGKLRNSSPGVGLRLRAIQWAKREGRWTEGPDSDCTRSELGQRLGIAALYGGQGDSDNARAAALLACAGVSDTPRNREAVIQKLDAICRTVQISVSGIPEGR